MRGLADFIGIYSVDRRIEDRLAGAETRFAGQASISRDAEGAVLHEVGQLILGAQKFSAERRYLWRAGQGGRIAVQFDDGRAFHDFDPQQGGAASDHLCGADLYRGGYDVTAWPNWSLRWDVTGPRKDYTSVTRYVRR